jgi:YebC/PmpR family DNA-binding regulatory protein
MAGHSKWAQIKHKKGATDAAKSRVFSKFARELTVVSKQTGGNVSSPQLAAVVARAKAANMPKDNIDRAIAKGQSKEANDLEQVVYEFYGPGGIAIIANALTDSRNRTTQEIKLILTKNDFELGTPGSASWAFTKSPDGRFRANEPLMDIAGADEEKLTRILELLDEQDDVQEVSTNARGYESTADDE